jgi:hypothetical protein
MKIYALRVFHGLAALYFMACLICLYYVALGGVVSARLFILAFISLAVEGFAIFLLNGGNCPLIHIQRKIGDEKPFFELLLPPRMAKRAIPVFAWLTWIAVGLLIARGIKAL